MRQAVPPLAAAVSPRTIPRHRLRRALMSATVAVLAVCGIACRGAAAAERLDVPPGATLGALRLLSALVVDGAGDPGFGGFSGLEVSPDGTRLWAIGDRGTLLTARLVYDDAGRLAGLADRALAPLRDLGGTPVRDLRADSEGLARLPGGAFAVSFERTHRVLRYPGSPAATLPEQLPMPPGALALVANRGIEALTALADGSLLAIGEMIVTPEGGLHAAWLGGEGGWAHLAYVVPAQYRPTGAATLPDGDVIAIERRNPRLFVVGGRIVLIPRETIRPGAQIGGIELARLTPPLLNGNFEGIAAWRDPAGRTRILVISDDNFLPIQRTLLLEFVLVR